MFSLIESRISLLSIYSKGIFSTYEWVICSLPVNTNKTSCIGLKAFSIASNIE